MKLGLKITIAVLTAVTLAAVVLVVLFPNYIKTLWYYFRYSPEESQEMIEETDQAYSNVLDMISKNRYTLTNDDKNLINSGVLTEDEIVALLMSGKRPDRLNIGTAGEETNPDTTAPDTAPSDAANHAPANAGDKSGTEKENPPGKKPQTSSPADHDQNTGETPAEEDADSSETQTDYEVARIVARMYTYKTKYLKTLDNLEDRIFSDYKALPESEKTPENRKKVSLRYFNEMAALEKECDKAVSDALAELTDILKKANRSLEMVDTLKKAYDDEKSLKKAYYLNIYTNGLRKDDKNAETTL